VLSSYAWHPNVAQVRSPSDLWPCSKKKSKSGKKSSHKERKTEKSKPKKDRKEKKPKKETASASQPSARLMRPHSSSFEYDMGTSTSLYRRRTSVGHPPFESELCVDGYSGATSLRSIRKYGSSSRRRWLPLCTAIADQPCVNSACAVRGWAERECRQPIRKIRSPEREKVAPRFYSFASRTTQCVSRAARVVSLMLAGMQLPSADCR
jgi:hypothetical protein